MLGAVACIGAVVLGWAGDPSSATTWGQPIRLGADLWLLAHLGPLDVVSEVVTSSSPADDPTLLDGSISLAPGALLAAAALLAARTGAGLARRSGVWVSLVGVLLVATTYAAAAWAMAWAAHTSVVSADPGRAALGAAAVAGTGALVGAGAVHASGGLRRVSRPAASQLRRVLGAAGVATVAWLSTGAVLVSVALAVDLVGVSDIHRGVAPGPVGGAMLVLVQALYLPTLAVWAASLVAGPGLALGAGTVSAGGSTVTAVPALPVLAVLPEPGAFPLWAWAGAVLVVGAGALAGWHAHRHLSSRGATAVDRLLDAAMIALLTGLATLGLCAAASGALGPWGPLGPEPVTVAAVVTAEVFVGCLLASMVLHLLDGRPVVRLPAVPGRRDLSRSAP